MASEQEKARSLPGYEIIETLGRGGFGIVHLARQLAVDREVALKIDNRVLATDRDRRRFMREVTSAGRLSGHPHVVAVYDAGVFDDGRPYMVLELCPNGSLADRLRDEGALAAAEVQAIGGHIADALAAAHAIGVLHRDVKPANILINQFGSVALADFGLATMPSPGLETSATREALTPAYAPPEAFRLEAPTPAGDVYALGATLYALLQGRPPRFPEDGAPSIAALMALHHQPVPDITGVPPALTAVLRQALAYDPADRPPDAAALRDMLADVDLNGPAAPAYGSGRPAPVPYGSGRPTPAPYGPAPSMPGSVPGAAPGTSPGAGLGAVAGGAVGQGGPGAAGGPATPAPYPPPPPGPIPAGSLAGHPGWATPPGSVPGPGFGPAPWGHSTGPGPFGQPTGPGPFGQPTGPGPFGQPGGAAPRRRRANPSLILTAAVVVAVGLVGAGVALASRGDDLSPGGGGAGLPTASSSGTRADGTTTGGTTTEGTDGEKSATAPAGEENLLTPAGARRAADALRAASGSNKVIELTVYKEYALAEIPAAKAGRGLYDKYEYRDGRATRSGPGGTYDTGKRLPDLTTVDWNVLPRLFARADAKLGVAKPTMRYVIVDGGLIPALPTIRVYLLDGYGAGYLNADLKGKVRAVYPRS